LREANASLFSDYYSTVEGSTMFVVETYDEESRKQESWGFGELKLAEEFMTRKWKEGYLCRIDCPSVSVIGDGTVVDKLAVQLQLLDGEV
jgi:hypothetical protein